MIDDHDKYKKVLKEFVRHITIGNETFFSVVDYAVLVDYFNKDIFPIKDISSEIFYIPNDRTKERIYEIYHYALNIRINPKPDFEKALLLRTTTGDISKMDPVFVKRFKNIYFEILPGDKESFIKHMKDYFEYIKTDTELIKLVKEVFGSYSPDNLYFEIY